MIFSLACAVILMAELLLHPKAADVAAVFFYVYFGVINVDDTVYIGKDNAGVFTV